MWKRGRAPGEEEEEAGTASLFLWRSRLSLRQVRPPRTPLTFSLFLTSGAAGGGRRGQKRYPRGGGEKEAHTAPTERERQQEEEEKEALLH